MKKIFAIYICCFCLGQIFCNNSLAQGTPKKEPKIPTKIDDVFVLGFDSPFNHIIVDSDEKVFLHQEVTTILIGTQTKILNAKGKTIDPTQIKVGMQVEIKLEPTLNAETLIANSIKLKSIEANKSVEVKGFLDKVSSEEAFVSGKPVVLLPNINIKGKDEWKTKIFSNFQEIPLGSIVELNGTRREDGRNYISSAEIKPNLLTPNDLKLIEITKTGLTIPPTGQTGAGIRIGQNIYKLSQNLELNQYVTKVGYKIVPRYIKNLADGDPNKILFRFYVLEDDSINAMALADGSVFVHTGLLKLIENEAQLAFILAHEIGHVTNEHSRKSFESAQNRAMWMGIAGTAASVVVGQQTGGLIAQVGFGLLTNKHSRDMENDADRIGMFYAFDAGYDVRESEKVWRRMMGEKYIVSKVGTFLYSDHPSLLTRLKNTKREFITNYPTAKFDESIIGREKYLETVGVYFGWVKPKPQAVTAPNNQTFAANVAVPMVKAKPATNTKSNAVGTRPKVKSSNTTTTKPVTKSVGITNIRNVDFKNFTYPIFDKPKQTSVKVLKGKKIEERDKDYGNIGYQVFNISYGDVTGDGIEEAAVNFGYGELDADSFVRLPQSDLYIYTLKSGKLKLLTVIKDKMLENPYHSYYPENTFFFNGGGTILNGKIEFTAYAMEGMCCPKWEVTMLLKWDGNKFSLLQTPSRKPWEN